MESFEYFLAGKPLGEPSQLDTIGKMLERIGYNRLLSVEEGLGL